MATHNYLYSELSAPIQPAHQLAKVLFVDDHHLLLEALSFIMTGRYEVSCMSALSGLDREVASLRPDLLVIDISLPDGDGVEAVRRLARENPDLKVLFLSMHTEKSHVRRALQAGAHGFISKRASAGELLVAIDTILNGRDYHPDLDCSDEEDHATHDQALTDRQKQVLRLVARGFSAKEIATDLNISVRTAEFHRGAIMKRLRLHSTALLTRYAVANDLV